MARGGARRCARAQLARSMVARHHRPDRVTEDSASRDACLFVPLSCLHHLAVIQTAENPASNLGDSDATSHSKRSDTPQHDARQRPSEPCFDRPVRTLDQPRGRPAVAHPRTSVRRRESRQCDRMGTRQSAFAYSHRVLHHRILCVRDRWGVRRCIAGERSGRQSWCDRPACRPGNILSGHAAEPGRSVGPG